MQLVCDDNNKKIPNVFIGYPGSVYDTRFFGRSLSGQNLAEKCRQLVLLSRSAEKNQQKLSHCWGAVEHTIDLFKQRFSQLYNLKSKNIDFISPS